MMGRGLQSAAAGARVQKELAQNLIIREDSHMQNKSCSLDTFSTVGWVWVFDSRPRGSAEGVKIRLN